VAKWVKVLKINLMNEKTVDKYHFFTTDLIGRGAFGSVYRGMDTKLNKVVAIKMLQKGMI